MRSRPVVGELNAGVAERSIHDVLFERALKWLIMLWHRCVNHAITNQACILLLCHKERIVVGLNWLIVFDGNEVGIIIKLPL